MDLTKIYKPFGELDRETKIALFTAWVDGAQIEYDWGAFPTLSTGFQAHYTYRVASTKPSIDWSHVAPQFKWMATDCDGDTWLYDDQPEILGKIWVYNGSHCIEVDAFASFTPGTCDWKDSLVQRPE